MVGHDHQDDCNANRYSEGKPCRNYGSICIFGFASHWKRQHPLSDAPPCSLMEKSFTTENKEKAMGQPPKMKK
jgi:hypothetical protein